VVENLNFTPFDTKWLPYSSKLILLGQTPKMEGTLNFYQLQKQKLVSLHTQNFGKGLKSSSFNNY